MKAGRTNKTVPFPARLLTGALVLTGAVLVALVWFTFDSYRNATTWQLRNLRIEELRGTIVHLDEVLTMSARMAVAMGDPAWERRYRQFEPQLGAAITEAMALTAHSDSAGAAAQTDAANLKLVEMENQGFTLVRAGEAGQARTILFSEAYEAQKKIYAEGMGKLINHLNEQLAANQRKKQHEAIFAIVAVGLCIGLLFLTWLSILAKLRRVHKELFQINHTLKAEVVEHTRAEEELQWKTAFLEAQVNSSLDGILVVDQAGRKMIQNQRTTDLLKIPQHIADDKDDEKQVRWVTGMSKNPRQFMEKVVHLNSHLNETSRDELELKDGTMLDRYSSPVVGKDGKYFGRIWTFRDITERKYSEAELAKTHKKLVEASRMAGMAEVATGVLHNVGNVLNSVNVASTCVADGIRKSKAANLSKVVALLRQHEADLSGFLTSDPKGKQLPAYLAQLAGHLAGEQALTLKELAGLQKNIEHIKDIVTMQQSFVKIAGIMETLAVADLVEDALKMNSSSLVRHDIEVIKEFGPVPPLSVEKHKVLQILVNLIRNAKHACDEAGRPDKRLTIRVANGDGRVRIAVIDNGVGIPPANLTRIFAHGFTTKTDGHGFGLHSGALAAKEMGGCLTVHSDGPGCGSRFTLELPVPANSNHAN